MVREYKGAAYSGEHGDGLVRSEWIEPIFGPQLARALEEIKDLFDPKGLMNPGKIVRPSKMDDRTLFRFKPGYATPQLDTALDWSEWNVPGAASQGFAAAVEMCNNNGHCRKFDAGTMCPSFRATGDEQHLTRGRANTLRLALSGQLGAGCARLRRDARDDRSVRVVQGLQARMPDRRRHGADEDRVPASLSRPPRLAAEGPADRLPAALRARGRAPGAARQPARPRAGPRALERDAGRACRRSAACRSGRRGRSCSRPPGATRCARRRTATSCCSSTPSTTTSSRRTRVAALRVLEAAGYRVHVARAGGRGPAALLRPHLPRGRHGGRGAGRGAALLDALAPYVARGVPIVGLEPSCLLTLRDEFGAMLPGDEAAKLGANALLFEEFLAREADAGRLALALNALPRQQRAPARPLPPEGVRRDAGGRARAQARARPGGGDDRVELLRHGGRLRLRGGALRRVDEDGRERAAAEGARGGRRRR